MHSPPLSWRGAGSPVRVPFVSTPQPQGATSGTHAHSQELSPFLYRVQILQRDASNVCAFAHRALRPTTPSTGSCPPWICPQQMSSGCQTTANKKRTWEVSRFTTSSDTHFGNTPRQHAQKYPGMETTLRLQQGWH